MAHIFQSLARAVRVANAEIHWERNSKFEEDFEVEAETFDMIVSPTTGRIRYQAAAGYTDDVVISMALCNFGLRRVPIVSTGINEQVFNARDLPTQRLDNITW